MQIFGKRRPKFKRKPRTKFEGQVDAAIGAKVRQIRIARGLSLKQLAKQIGVTYQQLQKYEKGTNRIGIGKLFLICKVLNVEPLEIFEDIGMDIDFDAKGKGQGERAAHPRDVIQTASALSNIKQRSVRRSLKALSQALIEKDS